MPAQAHKFTGSVTQLVHASYGEAAAMAAKTADLVDVVWGAGLSQHVAQVLEVLVVPWGIISIKQAQILTIQLLQVLLATQ